MANDGPGPVERQMIAERRAEAEELRAAIADMNRDLAGSGAPNSLQEGLEAALRGFAEEQANPDLFADCAKPDLRPFTDRRRPGVAALSFVPDTWPYDDPEDGWEAMLTAYDEAAAELDQDDADALLLQLLVELERQGSALAASELGAATYFCYLGLAQDMTRAAGYLAKAAAAGEETASRTLALMRERGELPASIR
ncbi:hypothetical protein B5C34_02900 [Pacificimonas flava]|uniref:Sel1 repeat family protein n=1 Tax=Pacificimonas flava TaxID=1234595 RepID=A0A219B2G5_9SPHN|nr:hypothetical protein B5C34_02900 [Pacificimonas flava]